MNGSLATDPGHGERHAPLYDKKSYPTTQIDRQFEPMGMSDYQNH